MTTDAGTRHGAKKPSAEAGGERIWMTSRWTELCVGRGRGDWVRQISVQREMATYGGW